MLLFAFGVDFRVHSIFQSFILLFYLCPASAILPNCLNLNHYCVNLLVLFDYSSDIEYLCSAEFGICKHASVKLNHNNIWK